jgi:hypothetical protein
MKIYKNMLNQPLPIQLDNQAISVGGKQTFQVDEEDWESKELGRMVKAGHIRLIETRVTVETDEDEHSLVEAAPESSGRASAVVGSLPVGHKRLEKDDDTLTKSSKMVELKDVQASSEDEGEVKPPQRKRQSRKRKTSRE